MLIKAINLIIQTVSFIHQEMKDKISLAPMAAGSLRYIISTGIGEGPEVVKDGHLLDPSTGMPITNKK